MTQKFQKFCWKHSSILSLTAVTCLQASLPIYERIRFACRAFEWAHLLPWQPPRPHQPSRQHQPSRPPPPLACRDFAAPHHLAAWEPLYDIAYSMLILTLDAYWRLTLDHDAYWRLKLDPSLFPSSPWSLLLLSAHLAAWARAYALATKSNEILELDTISTKPAVHDGDDEINQGCPPSNRSYQSSTSLMTPGLCNHQLHDEFYRTMKKERDVLQDLSSFLRCLSSSQSISLSALAPISPVKSRRVSRHDYHSKDLHLTITNSINACNVESLRPNSGVSQWCL